MNSEREFENEQISLLKTVNELHKNNKLTKLNAWKFDYIDSFQSLVQNHHRYTKNFQNVCPSMDTMARIYELRVDSVSTDILRIANRIPSVSDDSSNELNESNESHVSINSMHQNVPMQRNKGDRQQKRKRNNNLRSNIAKKSQLNAPLQLLSSLPDPILSKKQKIDGEEGKPNRMLLNLFPTAGKSNVSICDNQWFFDASRAERVKFDNNNDYDVAVDNFCKLPINVYREFMLIRPIASGYMLKETLDDDENEYCESIAPSVGDQSDSFIFDFDVMEEGEFYYDSQPNTNSQFEPHDYNNELIHENEADAVLNDEILEPPNDIQPSHPPLEDLSKGDYSYFKGIDNFSLGPSYWRHKNPRKRPYSNYNEPTTKPAKFRRKKPHEMPSFTTSEDSDDDDSFFSTQKVREVNVVRWDSQKNLLPMCRTNTIKPIPKDFFDFYEFAPNLRTWNDEARGKDSLNSPFHSSEDEAQIFDDSPPLAISPDRNQFEEMLEFVNDMNNQMNVEAPEWDVQEDISQLYTGAPLEVKEIRIKFDKLPKRINMKKINTSTIVSIKKQFERSIELPVNIRPNEEFEKGYATFANTHRNLVKRFKDIASPPISLLSILHCTNDHRFKLDRKPNEISNNFKIQQLKEHPSRPSFDSNSNENIVDVERNS